MTETGPVADETGAADEVRGTGYVTDPTAEPPAAATPRAAEAPADKASQRQPVDVPEGLPLGAMAADVDWKPHVESLARWRQGHLLTDVSVVWMAPSGPDPFTGVEHPGEDLAPVFDPGTRVPAIVTSQTCDLGATPPGSLHSFVQLAPLVRGDQLSSGIRKLARAGKLGYLVAVSSPYPVPVALNEDGSVRRPLPDQQWFADLRLQFPISKALLLEREPIEGFANDDGYLRFAEVLAYKAWRPALHAALSEDLPALLEKFVKENNANQQCFVKVDEVRVLFLVGDRLKPERASFYVLTDGIDLTADEMAVWARFQSQASQLLKEHGIAASPPMHCDVNQLSAAKYRASVHVPCPVLGPGRYL